MNGRNGQMDGNAKAISLRLNQGIITKTTCFSCGANCCEANLKKKQRWIQVRKDVYGR